MAVARAAHPRGNASVYAGLRVFSFTCLPVTHGYTVTHRLRMCVTRKNPVFMRVFRRPVTRLHTFIIFHAFCVWTDLVCVYQWQATKGQSPSMYAKNRPLQVFGSVFSEFSMYGSFPIWLSAPATPTTVTA